MRQVSRGLLPNAERISDIGISNNRAYVFGPLGTVGGIVDLRSPTPALDETMRQAESMERSVQQSHGPLEDRQQRQVRDAWATA
ncbi:MAG TPA: hypothetical protein VGC74_03005 [Stenotrophomonas sp.]|jgi:hypothetical protein